MNPNLPPDNLHVVERVRDYLMRADLMHCTWDSLAAALGVPYRTIQHRLACSGITWQRLKREEKARRLALLLESPGKVDPLDAAETLGYAEAGSFYLFFKQTRHETFTDWRIRRQTA